MNTIAYLDASAAMKLVQAERESAALVEYLATRPLWLSSELLAVELHCALRHLYDDEDIPQTADAALARLALLPCDDGVRARAGAPFDPPQRAFEALHLATALRVPDPRLDFVTYDDRQAIAADAAGLTVVTPV